MKKNKFFISTTLIATSLCLICFGASYNWPIQVQTNQNPDVKISTTLDKKNTPPIIESISLSTVKNVAKSATIKAYDNQGENITIKATSMPELGTIVFNGTAFTYSPFLDVVGRDKINFVAIDSCGNVSREGVININIEKINLSFYYADMINHPSHYSAIKLKENNIIIGKKIGGSFFFEPKLNVTREKLLIMSVCAAGKQKHLKPTVNTELDNDIEIPTYLKPYVKYAIDENLIPKANFKANEIPTVAEAVVLVSNIAKIPNVSRHNLTFSDVGQVPNWAMQSYMNLSAYKMLDLYGNMANPNQPVSNGNTADLMWQLYKYVNK
jgi:hypothetical protein